MQFSSLRKSVFLKNMIYSFSRMVFDLFQGLTYQNDPLCVDCLVLLHSFFVWFETSIVFLLSFICFVFELRFFHNSFMKYFICMRFLITSKCLNFLWCVLIKCVYFLQIFSRNLSNHVFPDKFWM